PLAELEPLAGTRLARLLALDRARIPRQEAVGPELGTVLLVGAHQRPGNGQAERAGLAGLSPPVHVRLHVERTERIGGREGLLDVLHQRRAREVVSERAAVHVPLAGAGRQVDAGDTGLAAAHGLPPELGSASHAFTFWTLTVYGRGCCASWGCSGPA